MTAYVGHCWHCGEPATHDVHARTTNPPPGHDYYRARQACGRHLLQVHHWAAAAGRPTVVRIGRDPQGDLFGDDAA